jgi:hypothetical protein
MNVEIINQNNSKHLLSSCFNSNSSALQQNRFFYRKKITKDGCEGEKIFAQLKTVLCIFVYLCAI